MRTFFARIATPHITPHAVRTLLLMGLAILTAAPARPAVTTDLARVQTISDGALSGAAAFSPTEMQIAAIGTDGAVRVMQTSGAVLRTLKANNGRILSIAYAPDGRSLLAGVDTGEAMIFDVRSGTRRILSRNPDHPIRYVAWLSDPDRCILASAGRDGAFQANAAVVEAGTGKPLWTFSAAVREGFATMCPARDGRRIVALGVPDARGAACFLDGAGGGIGARFTHADYPNGWLSVCLSPDGKTLATGQARDIVVWDVETGRPSDIFRGHDSWVVALAFSPNGRYLASGSRDGTARLWDVARGEESGAIRFESGMRVASVSFSPDNTLLLAGTWADHVLVRVPSAASAPSEATD